MLDSIVFDEILTAAGAAVEAFRGLAINTNC